MPIIQATSAFPPPSHLPGTQQAEGSSIQISMQSRPSWHTSDCCYYLAQTARAAAGIGGFVIFVLGCLGLDNKGPLKDNPAGKAVCFGFGLGLGTWITAGLANSALNKIRRGGPAVTIEIVQLANSARPAGNIPSAQATGSGSPHLQPGIAQNTAHPQATPPLQTVVIHPNNLLDIAETKPPAV